MQSVLNGEMQDSLNYYMITQQTSKVTTSTLYCICGQKHTLTARKIVTST